MIRDWLFWGQAGGGPEVEAGPDVISIDNAARSVTLVGATANGPITWTQVGGDPISFTDPDVVQVEVNIPVNYYSETSTILRITSDIDPLVFDEMELKTRFESNLNNTVSSSINSDLWANRRPTAIAQPFYANFFDNITQVEGFSFENGQNIKPWHFVDNFINTVGQFEGYETFSRGFETYTNLALNQALGVAQPETTYLLNPGDSVFASLVWQDFVRYDSNTLYEVEIDAVSPAIARTRLRDTQSKVVIDDIVTNSFIFFVGTLNSNFETNLRDTQSLKVISDIQTNSFIFYSTTFQESFETGLRDTQTKTVISEIVTPPFEFSSSSGTV